MQGLPGDFMSTLTKIEPHACPKCGSHNINRSRSRGLGLLVRLAGFGCYRCGACHQRFNQYRGWGKIHTQLLLGALLLAGFVILTWAILSRMGYVTPPPTE
jgi:DNA-directed RNA polymerase subunit RPC12/RpoP